MKKSPTLDIQIKEESNTIQESLIVTVKDGIVEKRVCDKKDGTGDEDGDNDGTGPGKKKKKKSKFGLFLGDK